MAFVHGTENRRVNRLESMASKAWAGGACIVAVLVTLGMGSAPAIGGTDALPGLPQRGDIVAMIDRGQFSAAEGAIAGELERSGLDASERAALQFQRERMHRIRLDFKLTRADVESRLRASIPDLRDDEFLDWERHGLFERQMIDGEARYFVRAASNLFRLSAEARARRKIDEPLADGPMESANAHHGEVRDAALASGRSSVAPRRLRVTQSLSVHADAVADGGRVRAWIPYPRLIQGQQQDLRFVASDPPGHEIAPEAALQRTVYLERNARHGAPTKFSITYELTVYAQYTRVDAQRVVPATIDALLAPSVAERPPHIVFSHDLRLFSRQIVGDETNPWRIAQKLYAAVDRIPWVGAREYSTITDIAGYALHAGHADCGQQTLLLMSLLRLNGIPSRWQSGMVYSDGDYNNLHDWGWLYIAPYGWLPMDVTFGRLDSADPDIAGFYLGGLDAYRIAFNDDYGRELVPAKKFFRSETIDLQRGEAESDERNLYFDEWDYDFAWQMLPVDRGRAGN